MFHNQRKSIDAKNRSYIDDEIQQISLNYTSSIKSQNKDIRPRFYSSNQKPQKRYDYSNDFRERPNHHKKPQESYQYDENNYYGNTQNNTSFKHQRRDRRDSRDRFEKDMDLLKQKTLEKSQFHNTNKNQRRIGKNYYGGLGTHGLQNQRQTYGKKNIVDHNVSINERDTFSFANKQRPPFDKYSGTHKRLVDQNKQNTNRYTNKTDNQIKTCFEKLNEEQILQKIGRINKLNGQINSRLQKLLSKVSNSQ